MVDAAVNQIATPQIEAMLRAELARGDRALGGVAPVLSHMLASAGHALVNEDIIARLRGMLNDCARQLLEPSSVKRASSPAKPELVDALADELAANGPVLTHFYALAMEGHLTHRLEQRSSIDTVLSPLLQELVASDQPEVAEIAMAALAAQSRFIQAQRRMKMPVSELPAQLFHAVLKHLRSFDGVERETVINVTSTLRSQYDEAATRLGLLTRLTGAMHKGAVAALELDHAGLALFVTALAALTRGPRDLAVLSCHEHQGARLALGLRAAGLDERAIERQFLLLEPAERLPQNLGDLAPERAAALLSHSAAWKGA